MLLDVRVDKGTLWIGSAAYPLSQITSVAPYDRYQSFPKRHEVSAARLIAIYIAALMVAGTISTDVGANPSVSELCSLALAALACLFFVIYKKGAVPAGHLSWCEVWIGVAGIPTVTVSLQDRQAAYALTADIAAAIANHEASFARQVKVQNLNIGNINTTHGPNSPIWS